MRQCSKGREIFWSVRTNGLRDEVGEGGGRMRIEMVMTQRTMMGELGGGVRRLAADLCGRGHEAGVAVLGRRGGGVRGEVSVGRIAGEGGVLHFHLESRRRLLGCFRALGRLRVPAVFTFHEPWVMGGAGHAPG